MLRLERFRRLSRHLPRPVRRHPRISVTVVAIAVAVALAFGVAFWPLGAVSGPSSAGRGPASGATSGVPSFTYSGTWSLLDLQRHIGAGEVVAVTAAPAGANTSAADPSGDQHFRERGFAIRFVGACQPSSKWCLSRYETLDAQQRSMR